MSVKLLTEHYLEFLSLKGGCTGKMPHCWKSLVTAHIDTVLDTVDSKGIHSCNYFVFVALRPKSTAMVMVGRSVHLTTLFPGQA